MVVTGLGIIAPSGIGKDAFWRTICEGISAADIIKSFDVGEYRTEIAAEVRDFQPTIYMDQKTADSTDRFAQFGIAAAKMAIEDAGLDINRETRRGMR